MNEQKNHETPPKDGEIKEKRPLFSQEPRSKRMRVTHHVTH